MKWVPNWLSGDDGERPYPAALPTLKCATCHRFVDFSGQESMDARDWLHADDASPICHPVGVYRS